MTNSMAKLIYCATPSRIANVTSDILKYVSDSGQAPLHPFCALPYEFFEGGKIGREKTIEFCLRLIDAADELWLFGVSKGTLIELNYAHDIGTPIQLLLPKYDPKWEEHASLLKNNDMPKEVDLLYKIVRLCNVD